MISGRDVLHNIDASIADARGVLSETGRTAATQSARIGALERAEADAYSAIAKIRIRHLREDDIAPTLGGIDQRAIRLIEDHDGHLVKLANDLERAEGEVEKLEKERRKSEQALEAAVERHELAVDKTHKRLQKDEDYIRLSDALVEANAISDRAQAKLELVVADRAEKGAPYEKDALFSYLWKRKFATREYKAFLLFAALDRWVARLIRYRDARLNYARLLELPERFEDHAEQVDATADKIASDIEEYERTALENDGVGKLRKAAETARVTLDEIDKNIENAEAAHLRVSEEYNSAASGHSGPLDEARKLLASAVADRPIPDLKVLAAQTLTLDDDLLVDDLIRLKRERFEFEENGRTLKNQVSRQTSVLSELEQLRRRFKIARYDSPYSEFSENNLVSTILRELVRGAVSQHEAWRRLKRSQRRRQRDWSDDFGGREWRDGLGLPRDWGGPTVPRPRIPTGRPFPRTRAPRRAPRIRIPRRGGGGFKTGGGF